MTFQCFLILLVAQLPTSQAEIGHVKPNIDDKKCFHLVSCGTTLWIICEGAEEVAVLWTQRAGVGRDEGKLYSSVPV